MAKRRKEGMETHMTASIVSAQDTNAARQRKLGADAAPVRPASRLLPPVSATLIDTLFDTECGQREDRSFRRAA